MSVGSLRFEARWSRLVWCVTLGVLLLVAVAEVLLVRAAYTSSRGQPGQSVAVLGVLLSVGIFAGIARFAPWDYIVRRDAIVVGRLGSPLMIPYEGIREVRRTHRQEIGFAWRVFGSAGFLGWFGLFRSRRLGEFRACATNRRDLVLITRTNGAKMVISPHLPDAFLEAVRRNMDRDA
ncbi:MAG: PH domain-containing protein [Planctomycetes bacterium]|nr:PH domain-containing protein [Planctomycetota bacterium]